MVFAMETSTGVRTYRYTAFEQISSLAVGAIYVAVGCVWFARDIDGPREGPLSHWAFGIGLFLMAAYFAISAAYSVVILDQDSVTLRGILGTKSIRRSSVRSYLIEQRGRQGTFIRLISNLPHESDLLIPKRFAFDDAWREWISSLTDFAKKQEASFSELSQDAIEKYKYKPISYPERKDGSDS